MLWLLGTVLVVAVASALLWWSPIIVRVEFYRQDGDDEGSISGSFLFGLIRRKRELTHLEASVSKKGPTFKVKSHDNQPPDDVESMEHRVTVEEVLHAIVHWQDWLAFVGRFLPVVRRMFEKVEVEKLYLHCRMGTGEVITTGVICGTCSAMLNSCIGYLSYVSKFTSPPDIKISPDFQRSVVNASVECILKVRTGYAIKAIYRLQREWKRRPSYGTPNSGADANRHGEYS